MAALSWEPMDLQSDWEEDRKVLIEVIPNMSKMVRFNWAWKRLPILPNIWPVYVCSNFKQSPYVVSEDARLLCNDHSQHNWAWALGPFWNISDDPL